MTWYVNKIRLPEKHYVGLKEQGTGEEPLGFMTPFGTDKAYEKRKETVDNWCLNRWYRSQQVSGKVNSKILDNKPMTGFKLTFDIRHGYKGSPDAWRIRDPRGFELEIRSHNLAHLMATTTIKNGEFDTELIWARSGADNILLSTETEEYKEVVKTTEIANSVKVSYYSMKDIKPGFKVVLENGVKATYLGRFFQIICSDYEKKKNHTIDPKKKKFVFFTEQADIETETKNGYLNKMKGVIFSRSSTKVAEILDQSIEYTEKEAEKLANKYLYSDEIVHDCGWACASFTFDPLAKIEVELEDSKHDLGWYNKNKSYVHTYIWHDGKLWNGRMDWQNNYTQVNPNTFDTVMIPITKWSGTHYDHVTLNAQTVPLDTKVWKLKRTITTNLGNTFVKYYGE